MSNTQTPAQPSQFQIDEAYKQVRLNTRQKALDYVIDVLKSLVLAPNVTIDTITTEAIIKDAQKIEEYILKDIDTPVAYAKPSIVPAKSMPGK